MSGGAAAHILCLSDCLHHKHAARASLPLGQKQVRPSSRLPVRPGLSIFYSVRPVKYVHIWFASLKGAPLAGLLLHVDVNFLNMYVCICLLGRHTGRVFRCTFSAALWSQPAFPNFEGTYPKGSSVCLQSDVREIFCWDFLCRMGELRSYVIDKRTNSDSWNNPIYLSRHLFIYLSRSVLVLT